MNKTLSPSLKNILRCCKVFVRAVILTPVDILKVIKSKHNLNFDVIKDLNLTKEIKFDLRLPVYYEGTRITWTSSDKALSSHGILNRSLLSANQISCRLTAEIRSNAVKVAKRFDLILGKLSDTEIIEQTEKEVTFDAIKGANNNPNEIISDLVLPVISKSGAVIEWSSSNNAILHNGSVCRHYSQNRQETRIKAVFSVGEQKGEKEFILAVSPAPEKGKSVCIFVPHGDDEVLMAVNVIRENIINQNDVSVCFFTNTDRHGYEYAEERHELSISALGYLGVPREKIYMLSYSNAWETGHIYHKAGEEIAWSLIKGDRTYSTSYFVDYHTQIYGEPAVYTRNSVINDIITFITEKRPDIIYVNDLDLHHDHRAYSLLFEEAIGSVLKDADYHPILYKGFVYLTNAYAKEDFFRSVLQPTKKPRKEFISRGVRSKSELENPAYSWDSRICFSTLRENTIRDPDKNVAMQALSRYQKMYPSMGRFLNSDYVFWKRRTDSLSYMAKYESTSGNAHVLNDFKLADSCDIIRTTINFNSGIWKPENGDTQKTVTINLNQKESGIYVKIYKAPGRKYSLDEVAVRVNGGDYKKTIVHFNKQNYTIIFIPEADVKQICLRMVCKKRNKKIGITEIEIYRSLGEEKSTPVQKDHIREQIDESKKWIYPYVSERFAKVLSMSEYDLAVKGVSLENGKG